MRALRIVLVALALVLASLALAPSLTAAPTPSVASCGEAREPDGGGWVLLLAGRSLNGVKSVGVSLASGAEIGEATVVVKSKTLLVVRLPAVIARPAYPVPGDYRLDLRTSRQVVPVAVHLVLGAQDAGTIDAAALDASLRADLDDATRLEGEDASHYSSASSLTTGTLRGELYSAYDDLVAEARIGSDSSQVPRGDHLHDGRYVKYVELAAGNGLVLSGTTYSLDLGGSGSATSAARSDHEHDAVYPKSSALAAPGAINDPSNPLEWTRLKNVPAGLADGVDSDTTYEAGTGLSLASGVFGVNFGGTGSSTTAARSNHDHTGTYLRLAGGDVMTGKLDVSSNDGVLFGGTVGVGSIPASGDGTRFMWYPGKAALRAGQAVGTDWDDANIGSFSLATGFATIASGENSAAMGVYTTASGRNSTATGDSSTASGYTSTAIGTLCLASGRVSTAMGLQTVASGDYATAAGTSTTAQSAVSMAIGRFNTLSGDPTTWVATDPLFVVGNGTDSSHRSDAFVIRKDGRTTVNGLLSVPGNDGVLFSGSYGSGTIPATGSGARFMWYPRKAALRAGWAGNTSWDDSNIGPYSLATGYSSIAASSYDVSMGYMTAATGAFSMATGNSTYASGNSASAFGGFTRASGLYSTAMGNSTYASGSVSTALGNFSTASGDWSTAMGDHTVAQSFNSLAIGRNNVASGSASSWVATDPLFVVGNGSSEFSRSDALTLLKNGNLTIAGTLTQNSDERLKKDVAPITEVLSRLAAIRGVTYEFKDPDRNPAGRHVGLLAQEVRKAFPELVSEDASGGLSVAYGNFTAVLLEAVKEQQREIEARDRELADLRERLERVERLLGAAVEGSK